MRQHIDHTGKCLELCFESWLGMCVEMWTLKMIAWRPLGVWIQCGTSGHALAVEQKRVKTLTNQVMVAEIVKKNAYLGREVYIFSKKTIQVSFGKMTQNCVGEVRKWFGEMTQIVGEMTQIVGEMKQNCWGTEAKSLGK